jgi:hypothetical protein
VAKSQSLTLSVSPRGELRLVEGDEDGLRGRAAARVREAFERGEGHGLLQLGAGEVSARLTRSRSGAGWRRTS